VPPSSRAATGKTRRAIAVGEDLTEVWTSWTAPERPVDLAVALRWLGGDQVLLRELVGIFVDDSPTAAGDARRDDRGRHPPARARRAQSEGLGRDLGANAPAERGAGAEDAAHDGHTENSPDLVAGSRASSSRSGLLRRSAWPEGWTSRRAVR